MNCSKKKKKKSTFSASILYFHFTHISVNSKTQRNEVHNSKYRLNTCKKNKYMENSFILIKYIVPHFYRFVFFQCVLSVWNKHIFLAEEVSCYKVKSVVNCNFFTSPKMKEMASALWWFRLGWQPSFKHFVYFLKTIILLAFSSLLRLPQLWLSSHLESGLLMLFACSTERLMERVNMNVRYELFCEQNES